MVTVMMMMMIRKKTAMLILMKSNKCCRRTALLYVVHCRILTTQIHAPSGVYLYLVCICIWCLLGVHLWCMWYVSSVYLWCICGVSGISLVHNCDANSCAFYALHIFRSVSMPGLDRYHMILTPAHNRV